MHWLKEKIRNTERGLLVEGLTFQRLDDAPFRAAGTAQAAYGPEIPSPWYRRAAFCNGSYSLDPASSTIRSAILAITALIEERGDDFHGQPELPEESRTIKSYSGGRTIFFRHEDSNGTRAQCSLACAHREHKLESSLAEPLFPTLKLTPGSKYFTCAYSSGDTDLDFDLPCPSAASIRIAGTSPGHRTEPTYGLLTCAWSQLIAKHGFPSHEN